MKERRPLIEGLKTLDPIDPAVEESFVFTGKPKPPAKAPRDINSPGSEAREGKGPSPNPGRAPLTIRFRADFAAALKRASLERQLNGIEPFHLQDILEEAVEPWLRSKGYIS